LSVSTIQAKHNINVNHQPPTMDFTPSTWRTLGLSVAATYIGLGTFALINPQNAAKTFGIYPPAPVPGSNAAPTRGTTASPSHANADVEAHVNTVSSSMLLLGARDVSMGLAIGKLAYDGKLREAGLVIVSGVVLCVVDVWEIWRLKGKGLGTMFAVGAGIWVGIGAGMAQLEY